MSLTPYQFLEHFHECLYLWDKAIIDQKIMHRHKTYELPEYQKIMDLGIEIVPLLIEELRVAPRPFIRLLMALTNEQPCPEGIWGALDLVSDCWIEWWEKLTNEHCEKCWQKKMS